MSLKIVKTQDVSYNNSNTTTSNAYQILCARHHSENLTWIFLLNLQSSSVKAGTELLSVVP